MARQRHTLLAILCLGVAALLGMPQAQADKLSIFDEPTSIERPHGGMKMDAVVQTFGEPGERMAPVGQPPITRWVYDKFTVYFENDLVIRAVVNR